MESTITHVFGNINKVIPWGSYRISVVHGSQEQHSMCPTGGCTVLAEALRAVATDGFGAGMPLDGPSGIRAAAYDKDLLGILHDDAQVFAFASANIREDLDLFFLDGVVVKQYFQVSGAGKMLAETLFREHPQKKIALTTQNPVIYCLLRTLFLKVYPSQEGFAIPKEIQDTAVQLRESSTGKLDLETLVIQNMYEQCLYTAIPKSNDPVVNSWFQRELHIEDGITRNGFLFIGEDRK